MIPCLPLLYLILLIGWGSRNDTELKGILFLDEKEGRNPLLNLN